DNTDVPGLHLATMNLSKSGVESFHLEQSGTAETTLPQPQTNSFSLGVDGGDTFSLQAVRYQGETGAATFNLPTAPFAGAAAESFLNATSLTALGEYDLATMTLSRTGSESFHLEQEAAGGLVAMQQSTDGSSTFTSLTAKVSGGGSFSLASQTLDSQGATVSTERDIHGTLSLESSTLHQTGTESFERIDTGSRLEDAINTFLLHEHTEESFTRTTDGTKDSVSTT